MKQILIYGAPGAGKTTASRVLHQQTETTLYEGDYLREIIAQGQESEEENHFLFVGTKQAWRQFGALNTINVVKGLSAVRKSMRGYIDKELTKHGDFIFEAAFIDPGHYPHASLFLVVTIDEAKHRRQYFENREETPEIMEGFTASRIIQEYLIEEADNLDVTIVYNSGDAENLLDQFNL